MGEYADLRKQVRSYVDLWHEAKAENKRLRADKAALVEALRDMIKRFERCMIVGGTDEQYAKSATASARTALQQAEDSTS